MSTSFRSHGQGASSSSSFASDTDVTSVADGHHGVELSLANFEHIFFRRDPFTTSNGSCEISRFSTCIKAMRQSRIGLGRVCNLLNLMSDVYNESCDNPEKQSIVFVDHSAELLAHHPHKSNNVQPHVIAVPALVANSWYADGQRRRTRASVRDNRPPNRSPIAWHHVLSAALVDRSDARRHPVELTGDFLGALNQARPDLPGSFSLSMTRASCRIWWSDAAGLYATPELSWADSATVRALLGYVDRLYNPLVADVSISLAGVRRVRSAKLHSDPPEWLVNDDRGGTYWGDTVISVGRPWSRKSWVVRAARYRARGATDFVECDPVVIKDSFPTVDEVGFCESAILGHIHAAGPFPGVSLPITRYFVVPERDGPVLSVDVPKSGVPRRTKCRLILDGTGEDLYRCKSVLQFLMIMYDVVEVLRRLHQDRRVLHRDISLRNILCGTALGVPSSSDHAGFVRQVLAARYDAFSPDSFGPMCVLIDYDHASCEPLSSASMYRAITGTLPFMSCAVASRFQIEEALPPVPICALTGNAKECYLSSHGQDRYERLSALHDDLTVPPRDAKIPPERAVHGPRHDVESCCWLMIHFLTTASPAGVDPASNDDWTVSYAQRIIDNIEETQLGSRIDSRMTIPKLREMQWARFTHPGVAALAPFLGSLCLLLDTVYDLLEPQPDPYHLHEAVQRLLLQEICRMLDDGEEIELDTLHRRELRSVFNISPAAALRPLKRKWIQEPFEANNAGGSRFRRKVCANDCARSR